MAMPRDKDRAKVYYHGTSEEHAQSILKDGFLRGRSTQERHSLAPMKGHTYITPNLSYAQIYAIGGDMAGNESAHKYMKGDYGYVFQVSGKHLKDIHPDEDSVGERATDEVRTKWNPDNRKFEPNPANKFPELGGLARQNATPNQFQNLKNGFIDAQARVGKKLNKVMSDGMKYRLIDDDNVHIAHNGPLPISKAWRIHKSKLHLLKRDGSNFFEHAEEVPLKKPMNEEWKQYKSTWRGKVSSYDDDYFDKKSDVMHDEKGKAIAYRHNLEPKKEVPNYAEDVIPNEDGIIHRGMSHDEYHNILKTGKIESKGRYNIGDQQKGLTYFTTKADSAGSYATSFAPNSKKPTPEKGAYIVSIKRPSEDRIKHVEGTGEHEVGVIGPISSNDIVAVYHGKVISHTPETKNKSSYSAASSRFHWTKIK